MTEQYLEPNQALTRPATPYEKKLAGALSEVFAGGTKDLAGVVAGLNGLGLNAPDGKPWDEARFRAEMRRLGE
jgi:hypothetical protein